MSRRRVVVTGLGCISPVGNTVADAWANLLAGQSGIANITRFDASGINCHFAGEVKDLDLDQYSKFDVNGTDDRMIPCCSSILRRKWCSIISVNRKFIKFQSVRNNLKCLFFLFFFLSLLA